MTPSAPKRKKIRRLNIPYYLCAYAFAWFMFVFVQPKMLFVLDTVPEWVMKLYLFEITILIIVPFIYCIWICTCLYRNEELAW